MKIREKFLYHQIHPLKLLADLSAGFGSLYPLWQHQLGWALLVMWMPPPVASLLIMRYANLEPYRRSRLGNYVRRHMTRAMEAVRLVGMLIMALGAWFHSWGTLLLGVATVLFGWLRGKIFSSSAPVTKAG